MARWYFSALLLAMALGQALVFRGFVEILRDFHVGGANAAWAIGIALFAGEVVTAVLLLGRTGWRKAGAAFGLLTTVGWTALAVQAFARGLEVDNCGCFGIYLGQPLRWWVLLQDAWFVGIAAWVWLQVSGRGPRLTGRANAASRRAARTA